jgi:catechol 2,3-dioxygenase-like lactoylglutathione lyase family enzyme
LQAIMLGRFLELSVATPRVLDAWQYYQRLGFVAATVADTWPHRYAALTDGRITVGLHDVAQAPPTLTYVRPQLARHATAFAAAGIEFERCVLGEDAFNEAQFLDPDGLPVRLLEARTYSPPPTARPGVLGWFEEIALPVADLERARAYWERLGFVAAAEGSAPWPHLSLTSDTLSLGLYLTRELPGPTLVFSSDTPAAVRAQLVAAGIEPGAPLPRVLDPDTHLLLAAPDGTPLLVAPPPA